MTHLLVMLLFALLVALVFGVVGRDKTKERTLYGLKVFAEFVGIGLALAWLLYYLPL
ncbi:MAG: hypothetical protein WBP93_06145 [Pyrinomonadaceae bacterium]